MGKHRFYDNTRPEKWKPVVGYEGHYKVSDCGRVHSLDREVWRSWPPCWVKRTGQFKRPAQHAVTGYFYVTLSKGGRSKTHTVHSLVLNAFRGPCPVGREAMHLDGKTANNTLKNLRWGTRSANNLMKRKHGTSCAGEANGNSRLSDNDERKIRKALAAGEPQRSIARRFGVSQAAISHINVGKIRSWPDAA